jgi:hypothetical protein
MGETAEVVWVFRPDDPRRQGKRETLPADLARLKVAEGLAKWPPAPKPEPEDVSDGEADEKASVRKVSKPDGGKH